MKIAMVFDGLGVGGIERVGIDYINILHELGYKVDVYNLNPQENKMEKELPSFCQVNHYHLPHKLCPELYRYGVKKWWWGKYVYPIIYVILSIVILIKKIVFRNKKTKYDVTIAFSGHINDLTFVANDFLDTQTKLCWLHGSLIDYMVINSGFGTLYRDIKNINVLSDYGERAALNGNKYLKELNINKIYNPTFIKKRKIESRVTEELTNLYGDYLLMIGRFTEQKDQITVIKAMSILKSKYKIKNKLIFVGDGCKKNEAEALVQSLNLQNNIIFLGNRFDVENFYATAKVFIHSSPLEGLPTVLLEAMSYGLPVVATKSEPGVPEILKNGEYGLVCSVGDEVGMAELIYKLFNEKKTYSYYSEKGKVRASIFEPSIIKKELKIILNNLK